MPSPLSGSVAFLSGSGLSMGDPQGADALFFSPAALNPVAGLWNRNPPAGATNPNPAGQTNPNPIANTNPDPPSGPRDIDQRPWPQPTTAPVPRGRQATPWEMPGPAALLAQALGKTRARIVRPGDRALTPSQVAKAATSGRALAGSNLWRWAPEFRARVVTGELLGWLRVQGLAVELLLPAKKNQWTSARVFELPAALPNPGKVVDEQVDKVMRAATEREDRLAEILTQMQDTWPFFEAITGLPLGRAPRTTELLMATNEWLTTLLMQLKHNVAALRPVQRTSLVQPLIPTPGHGSLPSGHAAQAAFTSELLHLLLYSNAQHPGQLERSEQLDRLARRIAFNRVVAGVHFPIDSQAGYALGTQMARYVHALAAAPGSLPAPMNPRQVLHGDFELPEVVPDGKIGRPAATVWAGTTAARATSLATLWREVTRELNDLRV